MSSPKGWDKDDDNANGLSTWDKIIEDREAETLYLYRAYIDKSLDGKWAAWIRKKTIDRRTQETMGEDNVWSDEETNRRKLKKMLMNEMRNI